jgi:hypothetical protein
VRPDLTIALTLVFLGLGALLVYEGGVAAGDLTQSARIIGGALLLSLGLVLPLVTKSRGKWKRPSRTYRDV